MRVLSTTPQSKKGNGGREIALTTTRSSLRFGVEELYPGLTQKKMCKDMFKRCPAAAFASSRAHNACADAAPDSVIPDPARDAKPSGIPGYKNACANAHGEGRKVRSNPADGTARPKNLRLGAVCAGPRAAHPRQLTPLSVHAAAVDGAVTVRAVAPCRDRSSDTAGSPSNTASVEPYVDMLYCKNGIANAAARKAVRIL
jgi:hypothetical protein